MNTTTTYDGTMFRCIPNSSATPLSTEYATAKGGRWNASGSFPVLYTFLSQQTARTWVTTSFANAGISMSEVQPNRLPDLMLLNGNYTNVADLTAEEGLAEVGLPSSYPIEFITTSAYSVTQPIGANIYDAGHTAILTRSASVTSWDGQRENWAELVIFTDNAGEPEIVERVSYEDWF